MEIERKIMSSDFVLIEASAYQRTGVMTIYYGQLNVM